MKQVLLTRAEEAADLLLGCVSRLQIQVRCVSQRLSRQGIWRDKDDASTHGERDLPYSSFHHKMVDSDPRAKLFLRAHTPGSLRTTISVKKNAFVSLAACCVSHRHRNDQVT